MYKYKTIPYDHQIEGFNFFKNKKFGALFMQQGTGKSKTIIDIVSNNPEIEAVLLIAPNGVQTQWHTEQLSEHSPVEINNFLWKTSKTLSYKKQLDKFLQCKDKKLKWFCVNIETFSSDRNLHIFRDYLKEHKACIIVDESTTIKNPNAKRTYNICYVLGEYRKRYKKIVASLPYSKYRYILTGTMVTNNPYDLWSMFEFLSHDFFEMTYHAFKARYGIMRRDSAEDSSGRERFFDRPINSKELNDIKKLIQDTNYSDSYICNNFGITEYNLNYIKNNPGINVPYKYLSELKEKILPYSFIKRKEDCLDLPEKIYTKVYVEMSAKQKKAYKLLEKEYVTDYADKNLSVVNKLTLVGRLCQIIGGFFPYQFELDENSQEFTPVKGIIPFDQNPKLNVIKRELEETDEKVIIFASFTAEIEAIIKCLEKAFPDKRVEGYYGKTPVSKRARLKEDFKVGDIDILVGNKTCAGVGLNLQKSALVYYYSNDYSLYYREQSEDRVHRIGQNRKVVYKDIVMKDTIDEKILKALLEKKSLLEYFRHHSVKEFILNKE